MIMKSTNDIIDSTSLVKRRKSIKLADLRADSSISIRKTVDNLKHHTFVGSRCTNIGELVGKRLDVLLV